MTEIIKTIGRKRFIAWGVHDNLRLGSGVGESLSGNMGGGAPQHNLIGVCQTREEALNLLALHAGNFSFSFVETLVVEEMTEPRGGGLIV